TTSIVVKDGGTLALGSNRWTFNANNSLSLDGGNITGTNQSGSYGNLDFNAAKTVDVLNTYGKESNISASIRLRNNVTFNVADGATLNITGKIGNQGSSGTAKVIKTGSGTLTLDIANSSTSPSENFVGGLDVNVGKVIVKNTDALGTGTTRGMVTVANGAVLELAAATGTVSNVISGAGAIKKTGTGTVTLAGTNTSYSGQTTIEGGVLVAGNASALGTGNVLVADGATLARGLSSGSVEIGGTLTTNGAAILSTGALDADTAAFAVTGAVTLDAGTIFDLSALGTGKLISSTAGTVTFGDGSTTPSLANFLLNGNVFGNRTNLTVSNTDGVLAIDSVTQNALALTWAGGDSGTWKANGSGWNVTTSGSAETFQVCDSVEFTNSNAGTVSVEGNVTVDTMKVSSGTYTFDAASGGGKIFSTGAVSVESGATMNLNVDAAFGGDFTVKGGGTASVSGSMMSTHALTVDGNARFTAAGTFATISVGGTLSTTAALTSTGALSVNGALTSSAAVSATQLSGSGRIDLGSTGTLTLSDSTKFNNWTGTVALQGSRGASVSAFNLNDYGRDGSKIVLNGVTGTNFYFAQGTNNALAFAMDIELAGGSEGGLTLTNGYSDMVYTFSGTITGDGKWRQSHGSAKQQYVFTGDVSGYSGTMTLSNGSLVTFGDGGAGVTGGGKSVSGTGTISMANANAKVTYNYRNDVLASTTLTGGLSVVKQGAGSLKLTQANTYTGGTTVEAGTLIAANASALGTGPVTVNGESVLKVAVDGGLNTGAGAVTFNEGAKFAIDLTTYDVALGTALSIITASAISFNGAQDFSSLLVEETFFDLEHSDLGGFASWAREWNYENGTLSLVLTVPEPSAFG
ncbi:MAG: autotransporter-associated beta strand repeat-containing protein, partial [Candidatus Spyradosoma sp.]